MQGSSETSSEETDDQKEDQDDSTNAKRSYECTFCRRGFTNAQALGGHMNIHRKDKAKAKQGTPAAYSSLPNKFTKEEYMAPSFIPQISSQTSTFYSIFESQRNYDIHFQPSTPNYPRNPPAYDFQYEFLNPTSYQSLNANQELSGPNLSLQIGSSYVTNDQVRRGIQKDGEVVDLELRL